MTLLGHHVLLDASGCAPEKLNDAPFLRALLEKACEKARLTVLQVVLHEFSPQGVTVVALLAESHASIHTWPERGAFSADVFSCRTDSSSEHELLALARWLAAELGAEVSSLRSLPRTSRV